MSTTQYKIGQYSNTSTLPIDVSSDLAMTFLQPRTDFDLFNYTEGLSLTPDYGLKLQSGATFDSDQGYYFCAEIQGDGNTIQTYDITFVTIDDEGDIAEDTQFITKVVVPADFDWHFVKFVAKSYENTEFNAILFSLEKTTLDLTQGRIVTIYFEEVDDVMNEIIPSEATLGLSRIGIYANAGDMFCLNNDAHRIGKTGIFEFSNTSVFIKQFSILAQSNFDYHTANAKNSYDPPVDTANLISHVIGSKRTLPVFTLDYVYPITN